MATNRGIGLGLMVFGPTQQFLRHCKQTVFSAVGIVKKNAENVLLHQVSKPQQYYEKGMIRSTCLGMTEGVAGKEIMKSYLSEDQILAGSGPPDKLFVSTQYESPIVCDYAVSIHSCTSIHDHFIVTVLRKVKNTRGIIKITHF